MVHCEKPSSLQRRQFGRINLRSYYEAAKSLQAGIEENHKEKVDRTHVLPAFTQPGMKMPVLRRDFLFSGNGS